ncbi:MAG: multifunctional CCA tRNA nucleotidyl transferase/2'3'-cyclic phosphodiesterase/2'nucleotidase/phosphatase [Pseudomonadota bacterium]|nr:multifunctional CCA tRNA nucleotidyl transferase/2'3'-cyclic phosphodiesterase/2'nucleotidase/phosphatase [Pseudomonadota bacterium]
MQIFEVGGAVRDELLGVPVKDRDFVVVGSTPDEMKRMGFKPVGKDFPVFLHPVTHEEYALARTERKNGRGYRGFSVQASSEITLEEDLGRRDLTINAMAKSESGQLIDPYNGLEDLKAGILRHVGPAFEEDPLRVLRIARFSARFGFKIAPETFRLLSHMVAKGELEYLAPERVWQEIARGLVESHPSAMLEALGACGALDVLIPPIGKARRDKIPAYVHSLACLDKASWSDVPRRFALMVMALDEEGMEEVFKRLSVPVSCREMALLCCRFDKVFLSWPDLSPDMVYAVLQKTDAFHHPARFYRLLEFMSLWGNASASFWQKMLMVARSVSGKSIPSGLSGREAGEYLARLRIEAIEKSRPNDTLK